MLKLGSPEEIAQSLRDDVPVKIEHSTGAWVSGWMNPATADDPYPSVLFNGTDRWTQVYKSKIRA